MKVLFINSCVRSESRTRRLAAKILEKLDGTVTEIDLAKENIMPLTAQTLEKRSQLSAAKKYDDEMFKYAKQFAEADTIVIAAPFWDLSFPALLKCYVEAVNVVGITFKYTDEGVAGLCKAKKMIYVTTSGGYIPDNNFGYGYFKSLAQNLYGIPQTQFFKAEGLDIIGADVEKNMQQTIDKIQISL